MAGMSSQFEHGSSESRSIQSEMDDAESITSKYSEDQTEVLIRGTRSYADDAQIRTYKRRWYILTVWCAVGFTNFEIWNTWGPIQNTAKFVFGWNTSQISWLVNMGLITLILLPPFFVYIMRHFGLRPAMVITVLTIAVGSAIRLIRSERPLLTKLVQNTGQFLNGIGGVVPMAGSTMLSLKWFPESERRTATAFATGTQQLGLALSFLFGPLLVNEIDNSSPAPPNLTLNGTTSTTESLESLDKRQLENQIYFYIALQAIVSGVLLILCCIYFPSAPPRPPSVVSNSDRVDLWPAAKKIVCQKKFWFLALTYGLFSGIFNSYLSVLDVDLDRIGFSQVLAGWIGFTATIGGGVCGVFVASIADKLRHHNPIRKLMLGLLFSALISFSLFVAVAKGHKLFKFSQSVIEVFGFAFILVTGMCSASTVPLIFELGSDILHPISEEMIGSMLVLVQNIFASLVLIPMSIPSLGDSWLEYAVAAGILFTIPMMLALDDTNKRSSVPLKNSSASTLFSTDGDSATDSNRCSVSQEPARVHFE